MEPVARHEADGLELEVQRPVLCFAETVIGAAARRAYRSTWTLSTMPHGWSTALTLRLRSCRAA